MGHRIAKHILTSAGVLEKSTYYILDAQGNTMSVYERTIDSEEESVAFAQTEKHIYGSSRLGMHNEPVAMLGSENNSYSMEYVDHRIGERTYELSNHLGNVLSVVSDKVISKPADNQVLYNNDFSSSYTGFVSDPGVVLSLVSGQLQVSNVPTHYCTRRSLNSITTAGHTYKVRFKIDLNGSGIVLAYTAINSTIFGLVSCTSNGTYEFTYTPAGTTFTSLYLRFESGSGATSPRTFYIDDVVIEDITVNSFMADIRQSTDYSPFGVTLKGRDLTLTGNTVPYSYSFQGQEHDDEIKGEGNSVNFEFRMHDPRIGRFFAQDPLIKEFPWNSPYNFAENKPIAWSELEGPEAIFTPDGKFSSWGPDKSKTAKVQILKGEELITLQTNNKGTTRDITITEFMNRVHWTFGEGRGIAAEYYAHAINNKAAKFGENTMYKYMVSSGESGSPDERKEENFNGDSEHKEYNDFSKDINTVDKRNTNLENINNDKMVQHIVKETVEALNGETDPTGGARHWAGGESTIEYAKKHSQNGSTITVIRHDTFVHVFYLLDKPFGAAKKINEFRVNDNDKKIEPKKSK